jgi:GTP cyclohydrolase II
MNDNALAHMHACFAAIKQGQPVLLLHQHMDGRQSSAWVQTPGGQSAHALSRQLPGHLLLSEALQQHLKTLGLGLSASKPVVWSEHVEASFEAICRGLSAQQADQLSVTTMPVISVPNGGGQTRHTLMACAYDLVRWAACGAMAWCMMGPTMSGCHGVASAGTASAGTASAGTASAEGGEMWDPAYANALGLLCVSSEDLMAYAVAQHTLVNRVASSMVPMGKTGNDVQVVVYRGVDDSLEHVALVCGDIKQVDVCPVRVHSECLTGDVFASGRCDCGWQLQKALGDFQQDVGIILYLRQEGRGIGLAHKMQAYDLQDQGMDTVEANHQLGFDADERSYGVAVHMLRDLGVGKIKLFTNNPRKVAQLERGGIDVVSREPLQLTDVAWRQGQYLQTKQQKLGHLLALSGDYHDD